MKFHLEHFFNRESLDNRLKELGLIVKRWRLYNSRGNPLNPSLYVCKRVKGTENEYYLSLPSRET